MSYEDHRKLRKPLQLIYFIYQHRDSRFVNAAVSVKVSFATRVEAFSSAHAPPSSTAPTSPATASPWRPVSGGPEEKGTVREAQPCFYNHTFGWRLRIESFTRRFSLVCGEVRAVSLGGFLKAPLTRGSAVRPLVAESPLNLAAVMLGALVTRLLFWPSTHSPHAWQAHTSRSTICQRFGRHRPLCDAGLKESYVFLPMCFTFQTVLRCLDNRSVCDMLLS